MENINERKEELADGLVAYTSGTKTPIIRELLEEYDYSNDLLSILTDFVRDWDGADCDPDGATEEQNRDLDGIIDRYAAQIIHFCESFRV